MNESNFSKKNLEEKHFETFKNPISDIMPTPVVLYMLSSNEMLNPIPMLTPVPNLCMLDTMDTTLLHITMDTQD